jgi:NADH:ubiquinone oxidoreductase subunit E
MDKDKIRKIVNKHRNERSALLAILHDVQEEDKQINIDSIRYISQLLELPFANIYGLVTFYSAFSTRKKGKIAIKACDGIACHINGSDEIIDALKSKLKIEVGETTWDETSSLERVHCLGLCSVGPNVAFNEEIYSNLNKEKILEIFEEKVGNLK